MSDPVTVTTRTSWFSRLGSAFGGMLTGVVLVLAAVGLLIWNEGRSVQSIRANNEGAGAVVSVSAERVDPANQGKLIHITAQASAEGERQDRDLGVAATALSLSRAVEYYHWVETRRSETREKLGGGQETVTTYSYERQWTDTPQDSSGFQQPAQHRNPAPALSAAVFRADQARVGAFTVSGDVVALIDAVQPIIPTAEQAATASRNLSRRVSITQTGLYVGDNPAAPEVGDMRIAYRIAPQDTTVSLIGAQAGEGLEPYQTRAGTAILMVRNGATGATQMFEQAKASNQALSWILRGVGLAVLVAAFGMILAPLGGVAAVVPLFGAIVRMGTGLVALALGLTVSALAIASAWLAYRPLVALAVVGVSVAVAAGLIWLKRGKAKVAA